MTVNTPSYKKNFYIAKPRDNTLYNDVFSHQVSYLYQNAFTGLAANFSLAVLMAWFLWDKVEHTPLLYWFLALITTLLIRLFFSIQYAGNAKKDETSHRWYKIFFINSSLSGLIWGVSIWCFSPFKNMEVPFFLAFILGGLAAGSIAILGALFRVYCVYIIGLTLPLILWLFMKNSPTYNTMAAMTIVFAITMCMTSSIFRRLLLRSITLSNQLGEAERQAEQSNLTKSQFLSNMSHEIRTPMNSIVGLAHLLRGTQLDTNQTGYLSNIQSSTQHLLNIINDLLDFSKIEVGKLKLNALNFELHCVLDNVINQLTAKANEKGLELIINNEAEPIPTLYGDHLRLTQVLVNYVENAIKFTDKGKISLIIKTLEYNKSDRVIHFEIQDTGIGLTQKQTSELFQRFHQADPSSTRNYGGTGLSLAINKRVVELMGGQVGVESLLGKGSTFWFTVKMRVSKKSPLEKNIPAPTKNNTVQDSRILLVEDNKVNQMVAKALLENAGVQVFVANNGQEAIDMLLQDDFDCVFMDIQMPIMDGYEATKQIRAHPDLVNTPVIALTANARIEDKNLCLEAGMDDVLTKPIDPELLLATLNKWIENSPCPQSTDTA